MPVNSCFVAFTTLHFETLVEFIFFIHFSLFWRFIMTNAAMAYLSAGLGAGIAIIGVGIGIGQLVASALEASSRQPETMGDLRTTMIIGAALIEGAAFFALVICILLAVK
jgi:F-type H+-transporting ATPase subunit c